MKFAPLIEKITRVSNSAQLRSCFMEYAGELVGATAWGFDLLDNHFQVIESDLYGLSDTFRDRFPSQENVNSSDSDAARSRTKVAIASRTGVVKAMVYYYFENKEGLYQAVSHLQLARSLNFNCFVRSAVGRSHALYLRKVNSIWKYSFWNNQ